MAKKLVHGKGGEGPPLLATLDLLLAPGPSPSPHIHVQYMYCMPSTTSWLYICSSFRHIRSYASFLIPCRQRFTKAWYESFLSQVINSIWHIMGCFSLNFPILSIFFTLECSWTMLTHPLMYRPIQEIHFQAKYFSGHCYYITLPSPPPFTFPPIRTDLRLQWSDN